MKRLILALLFSLLAVAHAEAAITVATLGSKNQAASTTNVITTATNACASGSTIIVLASYATIADTVSSATDSAGNSYTVVDNITGTGVGIGWAYAKNTTTNLPVGGTITLTFGGSVTTSTGALCVQGLALTTPLDISNQTAQGLASTSATTTNTGTLRSANEIVMGGFGAPTARGTMTCGTGYTAPTVGTSGTPSLSICYQIVASSASVAFSPTWVNAVNYVVDLLAFSDTNASTGTTSSNLTTMGVGP